MVYDAGDSFISDDEEELCPLCVEEMDISDKNFKPCPCGYQVCQFCYNNIRQNPQLNGRCPACRRPYDDATVEYKAISQEEWKKEHDKQSRRERDRKQRQREKKESEQQTSRKHLSGMRVIQKNLVYVIGLNPGIPTEELHNTLRTDQFFGQYGKIQKIVINRRNNANGNPGIGVYVTFARKEDAAKCIAAVDGSINDGKYLRAAYGTTKYCSSYLRGQSCPNPNCMFLHEPGEEADSYTRKDLSTFQVTTSNTGSSGRSGSNTSASGPPKQVPKQLAHSSSSTASRPPDSIVSSSPPSSHDHDFHLPPTVSWATKASPSTPQAKLHTASLASYPPLPVSSAHTAASMAATDSSSSLSSTASKKRETTPPPVFEEDETHEEAIIEDIDHGEEQKEELKDQEQDQSDEEDYLPCPEPRTPDVAVTYMHDSLVALADPSAYTYAFSGEVVTEHRLTHAFPLFSYTQETAAPKDSKTESSDPVAEYYSEMEEYMFKPNATAQRFRASIGFLDAARQQQFELQLQLQQQQQQQLALQRQLEQQQQLRVQQQQFGLDLAKTATPPPPGLFASPAQANYANLAGVPAAPTTTTTSNNSKELLNHLMKGSK